MVEQRASVPELAQREPAVLRITQAVAGYDVPTDGLRIRLSDTGGRIVAQANARAARRPIRVQVAAATLDQAADDLAERLGRRILEAAACWSARPWPDSDDASVPSRLPPGERAINLGLLARIKIVPLVACPPEVAAAVMDLMDYPAHLFIDADTGLDAMVHRSGPTGYRLTRLRPAPPPPANAIPLTVDPRPAPALEPEQAMARLDDTGLGHLFFTDPDSGRGQLLYRRFDTRYTLVKDAG
ncbi:sigma 54 modulation/S30EA ribosomal C-terminal domain-containing protein [Catenulispora subtropica]|uniref:Dormancy-associated translation inhibitor n=1 Tax=Catenulispora subtropica TaxID=450798 RepID=A0ABP5CJP1_9ACTN